MNWELLADIATIITSLSIFFAVIQLIRESRSQNLQSFFYLHQYLSQEDFSLARKRVRTVLSRLEYSAWSEEDKIQANRVCASYDQTGLLG